MYVKKNSETFDIGEIPKIVYPALLNALHSFKPSGDDTYGRQLEKTVIDSFVNDVEAERIARVRAAFDTLCGQRNSFASRLFWYRDFNRAKQVALTENKPILSLRLLGNLTDEFSCANSRFFRTVLYADPAVSDLLREKFILHWQSVRPVPKITIDYGDGRKLVRTITGNSIHYTLSSDGEILDAIPGLYHAKAFVNHLSRSIQLNHALSNIPQKSTVNPVFQYHRGKLNALHHQSKVVFPGTSDSDKPINPAAKGEYPTARQAAPLAITKRLVEMPLVKELDLQNRGRMISELDEIVWINAAQKRVSEIQLSQASRDLIRSHLGGSGQDFERTIKKFKESLALDTLQNEYLFHRQIHQWFVNGEVDDDIEKLNKRVYADLFLTPDEDPWLGLLSKYVYVGIENNGVITH